LTVEPGALAAPPAPEVVAQRLAEVRARVAAAGRDPASVRIVAVTKGYRHEAVEAALSAGLVDVGENRADELVAKAARVSPVPGLCWHFLGALQRRRIRELAGVVGFWQTVARPEEGRAIAAMVPGAPVLVQVNAAGSPGQNGCALGEVPGLVAELRGAGLDVRGLMLLAPRGSAAARAAMRGVAEEARRLELTELSMGMTDDLDEALAEGSTMLRVGRALFGPRSTVPLRRDGGGTLSPGGT
jgi:PLP dependent protein